MTMSNRAYSLLEIKELDDKTRTFTGIASTPATDLVDDIVEPKGAQFKLPIPFLWQHDSDRPVGHVTSAKVTSAGIEVNVQLQKTDEPGSVKDRLDSAWQDIKLRLVRGLSIGFKTLESSRIEGTFGSRISKWLWLELSGVTIAANQEASILSIKQFDIGAPAASGHLRSAGDVPPGATGSSTLKINSQSGKGTTKMTTILELQEERKNKFLRIDEIDVAANGRTKTEEERKEFKTLRSEIEALDLEIDEKQFVEQAKAGTAKVVKAGNGNEGTESRSTVPAVAKKKDEPGVSFARLVKVKAVSRLEIMSQADVAAKMYGKDSETYQIITKANEVLPGTAASGNWGYDLISPEGAAAADFVEWLRSEMIVGKFGTNGIPALNRISFYAPYVIQTGAATGSWVGEGKPKPLSSPDYDRSQLLPLKMAVISVLTERNIRYSDPNSDVLLRNELRNAIVQLEDETFIDPANAGTSNVKPASITNGAESIVATGTGDADDIRLDIRALVKKFTDAKNKPRNGVLIMSTDNAMALGTMTNALGQPEFPGIGMDGGRIAGFPAIVSDYAGTNVVMVNASNIYYSDEGGIQVDFSREASLEMKNAAGVTQDGAAGTGAAMVSMFQNNMVAYRAEKTASWKRQRTQSVAYLTSVAWGGAVPAS